MPAEIKIEIDSKKAINDLTALALKIPQFMLIPLRRAALWIVGQSQNKYLRGPSPQYLRKKSGRLRTSIGEETKLEGKEVIAHIGTNVKSKRGFNYPGYWEDDGTGKGHGGPRPFLAPARDRDRGKWMSIFEKEFKVRLTQWVKARSVR